MAKLYFRYGAMGSSKSANILMVRYNYEERGQYAVLLKPRTDNRDGEHEIKSRIGLEAPQGTELLAALAKEGYDLPKGRVTVEACADALEGLYAVYGDKGEMA